jgi:glutamate decarboxylase
MLIAPNIRPLIKDPRKNVEDMIAELFSLAPNRIAESVVETRINRIIKEFLGHTSISSDVEYEVLAGNFTDSEIPAHASDVEAYIDYLNENLIPHSVHTSSPVFIGHMTSRLPYFVSSLGKLMAALNQNVVKVETSRAFTLHERQSLAMIHRLIYKHDDDFYKQHIQHSESTLGMLVSGGTVANITALWCARNACLGGTENFHGVEQEGLAAALEHHGYKGAVIIGSSLMHYSMEKAAEVLGIGGRNLLRVRVDRTSRVDLQELQLVIHQCRARKQCVIAIVGIAGTTETGAIDPLAEMAAIAREAKVHFHVDAAWGGPLLFSRLHRQKLAGIALADSVTIDGHKQLYLPIGSGMVLLRNPSLAKVIEKDARYIVRPGSRDLGRRSLEGSRPGAALFLHAAFHILGQEGYEYLINEGIRKALYMARTIQERPEFELLTEPETNILVYRYIPESLRERTCKEELSLADNHKINIFNERMQRVQRQRGKSFVSRTTIHSTHYSNDVSIVALRAVVANPHTTEEDINTVLEEQVHIAAELSLTVANS